MTWAILGRWLVCALGGVISAAVVWFGGGWVLAMMFQGLPPGTDDSDPRVPDTVFLETLFIFPVLGAFFGALVALAVVRVWDRKRGGVRFGWDLDPWGLGWMGVAIGIGLGLWFGDPIAHRMLGLPPGLDGSDQRIPVSLFLYGPVMSGLIGGIAGLVGSRGLLRFLRR